MKATTINELRTMANTSVNRDTLVGKLSAFELEEFGPSGVVKFEPSFHASTSTTNKKDLKSLYAKESEDMKREEDDFEKLEALFVRRVPKGPVGSKYEGKEPFKYFSCNKIGHFASRCLERNSRFQERVRRSFKPNPRYQNKYKYKKNKDKSCYIVDEEGITDSDDEPIEDSASGFNNGKEWVFLAIKEDDPTLEENILKDKALVAKIEEKDEWVIDSSCSHHMTGDKGKFMSFQ
ncbi:hypothetical protein SUGI_0133680 [Cryptomeria japonica]|nr:hypothetical protein SUGI_0133680 [Cryptomeria japonica]